MGQYRLEVQAPGLRWGVEPICRVLTEHGLQVAPSTYYEHAGKALTARERRDAYLLGEIRRVHIANYSVYGARKVWLQLNREGIEVARCTVERLMRGAGLRGAVRGKVRRTTIADPAADRARDLVCRNVDPAAPDRLWVADITYVSIWSGWVYVAFVVDAYARRILGWRTGTSMSTELVMDALEQAIWTRQRTGADLGSVVAHSNRGSQYVSIRHTERLGEGSRRHQAAGCALRAGAAASGVAQAAVALPGGRLRSGVVHRVAARGPAQGQGDDPVAHRVRGRDRDPVLLHQRRRGALRGVLAGRARRVHRARRPGPGEAVAAGKGVGDRRDDSPRVSWRLMTRKDLDYACTTEVPRRTEGARDAAGHGRAA